MLGNTAVDVASTATIGGSGAVGGSLTVNGTFAPGNSIESMGTGDLSFGATATYACELNSNALNGLFTYLGNTLANGESVAIGANTWRISYDAATGGSNFTADQAGASHFVHLTVFPEPSSSVLVLSALGLSLLIRRRAR